jgi:hypothetical protein
MQIAAEHSETVGQGSGVGMKERLLFDRVTLHSGDITPRNVERAAVVEANFADSGLTLGNGAAVAAGITTHSIAIQLFPKSGVRFANARVRGQNIAQGGHGYILRLRDWVCQELAVEGLCIEMLI